MPVWTIRGPAAARRSTATGIMPASRTSHLFVALACVAGGARCAEPEVRLPEPVAIYDDQPSHLWNRVHAALLVRTGPDGKDYGRDRLEPLLWKESGYLLAGKSAERAVAALEEFDRDNGETLIVDPVKRAVLHRDLWLVANWLSETGHTAPRLERALGKVIRRLALSPGEIAKLPDNYAAAKGYPARFDPRKPVQPFLPPDLFRDDGPWTCVGRSDGLTAAHHFNTPFNNSVFLVFLKLPGGREQTRDFLTRLGKLERVLVPNTDEKTKGVAPFLPPPEFPVWPDGTEVALVRRALLIDSNRRVAASPLTEGVQIRVVTSETPALTSDVLEKSAGRRPAIGWQSAFEFQLRRADLFAGTAGGLRDVSGERDFKTGFSSHAWDAFDRTSRAGTFPERSQPFATNRASCASCHTLPGAYSFNSVPGFAFGGTLRPVGDDVSPKRPPGATAVAEVEKQAVKWKEGQPAWMALVKRLGE